MSGKCVHRGCGKVFSDPDEDCNYHRTCILFPSYLTTYMSAVETEFLDRYEQRTD